MTCRRAWLLRLASGVVALASAWSPTAAAAREPLRVAAASDLKFAFDDIVQTWSKESGKPVRVSYGSSGNLSRQIAQGAPFDLFLSADESYVFELAKGGRTEDQGVAYAVGRLVLFAPAGSPVVATEGLEGLARLAAEGRLGKVAIANPAHAPYGKAAREALMTAGVWDALKDRLVLGENVAQTAQFATTGNVSAGLFARSLTYSPAIAARGTYALVPERAHAPLRQRMVLIKGARDEARELFRYLQSGPARAVLQRHGFGLPEN